MDGIVYSIKNKDNFPRIMAEIYASNEILAEYELNLLKDISKLELSLVQEYSANLELFFDQTIADIKSSGLNIMSFTDRISLISEILTIKTQCDEYIERMDIIE